MGYPSFVKKKIMFFGTFCCSLVNLVQFLVMKFTDSSNAWSFLFLETWKRAGWHKEDRFVPTLLPSYTLTQNRFLF